MATPTTLDLSQSSPTEIIQVLLENATSSINIVNLKRVNLQESAETFETVLQLISKNSNLKSLDLWGCKLNNDMLRRLCWAITNQDSQSNLQTLNLGYNSITQDGVRLLADCCCQSLTLKNVTIGSATIPVGLLKHVADDTNDNKERNLESKSKLRKKNAIQGHANLSNLGVGPLSAILVGVVMRRTPGMTSLNISGNNLRKEGTNFLCKELAHYDGLMHLDIGSNEIFPTGVEAIASMLRGAGGGLQFLSLADNNVTNWGKDYDALRTIIDAALDCEILTTLRLEGNVLKDDGCEMIAELILQSASLQELNLSRCQISMEGGKAIANAITESGKDSSLKILNLNNNSLGSRGSTPIVEAICEGANGGSITKLYLEKNNIPQGAAMAMVDTLSNNRDDWKLETIALSGNRIADVIVDCLISLPPLAPNRYQVMTGVDRMKVFKKVRESINAAKILAEKAAVELAKSPLRPPARLQPSSLAMRFGCGKNLNEHIDGYDVDPENEEIENISGNDANTTATEYKNNNEGSSANSKTQPMQQPTESLFTIDISKINVPTSLTSKSENNTGRSEHDSINQEGSKSNSNHSPKPANDNYTDSDEEEELSPRTVQRMQAAYAEMMGGGGSNNAINEEEEEELSTSSMTTPSKGGGGSGGGSSKTSSPSEGRESPTDSDAKIRHLVGGASGHTPTVLGGRGSKNNNRRTRVLEHEDEDEDEDEDGKGKEREGESKTAPSVASVPPPKGPRPKHLPKKRVRKVKTKEQLQQEREEREQEETRQKAVYDSMALYRAEKAAKKAAKANKK